MINPPLFWPNNLFRRDLRTLPGLFRGNVKVKGLVIIGVVPKIDLSVFLWRSSFCPKKPNNWPPLLILVLMEGSLHPLV